jgi:hypothetical protein
MKSNKIIYVLLTVILVLLFTLSILYRIGYKNNRNVVKTEALYLSQLLLFRYSKTLDIPISLPTKTNQSEKWIYSFVENCIQGRVQQTYNGKYFMREFNDSTFVMVGMGKRFYYGKRVVIVIDVDLYRNTTTFNTEDR